MFSTDVFKKGINIFKKYDVCPFCNNKMYNPYFIGVDAAVLKEKNVIGGGRRKAGCSKCGSSDRERLIYVYLKNELNVFNKKKLSILHMAPEKNITQKLLELGFNQYVCGDLFTEGYSYPQHVRNINILNIPFIENTFDLIICNHLLEHIPNDIDAMSEIFRVLKTGGTAILQVPISETLEKTFEDFTITNPTDREKFFGQFDHVRIYGQDYSDRLRSIGFKVNRVNIHNEYPKFGLNKKEDIFVCSKF